jgi:hypothetical protein
MTKGQIIMRHVLCISRILSAFDTVEGTIITHCMLARPCSIMFARPPVLTH